jgi:nucleoside-diphosphate-sugar epimerase
MSRRTATGCVAPEHTHRPEEANLAGTAEAVRLAARLLAGSVASYGYVSSLMVYRWPAPRPLTESSPTLPCTPDRHAASYAERKAAAERAIVDAFGDRALLARAGLVIGRGSTPAAFPGGCCGSAITKPCWRRGLRTPSSNSWMRGTSPNGCCSARYSR